MIHYPKGTFTDRPDEETTLFVGAVLCTREENYHDDSDFYAVCWDDKKSCLVREDYATTRFAGGGSASVDATDEVKAKASAWLKDQLLPQVKAWNETQAQEPAKGKTVKVVKGRKIPHGTTGEVFWAGWKSNAYDYNRSRTFRVGFKVGEETYWTDGKNVEVVDWEQYLKSPEEVDGIAERRSREWHLLFTRLEIVI
jgi:hypothetical protein